MSEDISITKTAHIGTINTTVNLNWRGLGEHFMLASSEDQARFLRGWNQEAEVMGHASEDQQYCWTSDAVGEDSRQALAARLHRLANFLEEA